MKVAFDWEESRRIEQYAKVANRDTLARTMPQIEKLRHIVGEISPEIIEGGLSNDDVLSLTELANDINGNNLLIAEVGSWKGASTVIWASRVIDNGGKVFAIDHWRGNEETNSFLIASNQDIFFTFKHNLMRFGLWSAIYPMVMDSATASQIFKDDILDLVFLDADHRYQCIKEDIARWLPKVKVGGILCGHDAELYYSNCNARERKLIDKSLDVDMIEKTKFKIHGGVIKALCECFNDKHGLMPWKVWYYKK